MKFVLVYLLLSVAYAQLFEDIQNFLESPVGQLTSRFTEVQAEYIRWQMIAKEILLQDVNGDQYSEFWISSDYDKIIFELKEMGFEISTKLHPWSSQNLTIIEVSW